MTTTLAETRPATSECLPVLRKIWEQHRIDVADGVAETADGDVCRAGLTDAELLDCELPDCEVGDLSMRVFPLDVDLTVTVRCADGATSITTS